MKFESWTITDIGSKRVINEDYCLISDKNQIYIVADGMGGHAGGEFASKIAIITVKDILINANNHEAIKKFYDEKYIGPNIEDNLKNILNLASTKIVQEAKKNTELKGMGTTCVVLYFKDKKAYFAHVGDSRLYQYRNGKFKQLTEDHSLVHEQVKMGLISKEEASRHLFKNIITRSIGVSEKVEVDTSVITPQKDDIYLLCTDGLSNLISDEIMKNTIESYNTIEACKNLVMMANEKGGDDNITVVIVKVLEV